MQSPTRSALPEKLLYDSAGHPVPIAKAAPSNGREKEPLDPVREAKLLRNVLAEQRLERQRAAETETRVIAELTSDLRAAELATQRVQQLRERDRRIVLTIAPGLALAVIIGFFVAMHRPAELPVPSPKPVVTGVSREPDRWSEQPGDAPAEVALGRLSHALKAFPAWAGPDVVKEADRLLVASGSAPCSVGWNDGARSLLVSPGSHAKAPLAAAITRCAEAVEGLKTNLRIK